MLGCSSFVNFRSFSETSIMDTILKWTILCSFGALFLPDAAGTNYAYYPYDEFRTLREPVNSIRSVPYSHDSYSSITRPHFPREPIPYSHGSYTPVIRPHLSRGQIPYSNHFNPQNDPLWTQFWDAYNYRGPLEEGPSTIGGGNFFSEESYYQTPDQFFRQKVPQIPSTGTTREDAYDRYKEYFSRRYGLRIDD